MAPPIKSSLILPLLLNSSLDEEVGMVHFSSFRDPCHLCKVDQLPCCKGAENGCIMWRHHYSPCTPHPRASLLRQIRTYNDRPHLARWDFYEGRVFHNIAKNTRTTMEHVLSIVSRREGDWPIWVYGTPGGKAHDVHLVPMGRGSSYGASTGKHRVNVSHHGTAWNVPSNSFAHPMEAEHSM